MKFKVKTSGRFGARIGLATFEKVSQSDPVVIETPCSLTTTRYGQVPHLIPDTLQLTGTECQLSQLPLDSQLHFQPALQATGLSWPQLTANKSSVLYSCIQNPMLEIRSGFSFNKHISVWTSAGRNQVTPASFLQLQRCVRPDLIELIYDGDVTADASSKRVGKSLERSLRFAKECLQTRDACPVMGNTPMLGALLGGASLSHRCQAAQQMCQLPQLAGYLLVVPQQLQPQLSQLHNGYEQLHQLCSASLKEVPSEKLRVMPGAWRPLHVLQLVQHLGVDLFDSSYPSLATERSSALVFPFVGESSPSDQQGALSTPSDHTNDSVHEHSTADRSDKNDRTELLDKKVLSAYEIDLSNKRYAADFAPLLSGCGCYVCGEQQFSLAYLHHLVHVRELLAPILLQIHNLYHWRMFFQHIRGQLAANGASLVDLIHLYQSREHWALNKC